MPVFILPKHSTDCEYLLRNTVLKMLKFKTKMRCDLRLY